MRGLEFVSEEDAMAEPPHGAVGRPREAESRARRDEFLRLVFDGVDCDEAARRARVKPERALAILTPIVRPLIARAA